VHATARTGLPATSLMGAAVNGNAEFVRTLLARNVDITVVSADRVGVVKNGPVKLGKLTALHAAITGGNADVVERLLKAGASVDAADVRGMTPLMWAVATDRPQSRIIRMLLASGAKPAVRSLVGDTATDWARLFNNPVVLAELGLTPVVPGLEPARHCFASDLSTRSRATQPDAPPHGKRTHDDRRRVYRLPRAANDGFGDRGGSRTRLDGAVR
jgi:Ankyrin repeats (3 copies)